MKLYSDTLTEADVLAAFSAARTEHDADIHIDSIRSFRPHRYAHGVEFYAASLRGNQATAHRPIGSYDLSGEARAASWDAYGWVISHLFAKDPAAKIGFYKDLQDYIFNVRRSHRKEPKDFLSLVDQHYPYTVVDDRSLPLWSGVMGVFATEEDAEEFIATKQKGAPFCRIDGPVTA